MNTPKDMIEFAIRKGLDGMIITDHDSVRGGLVGRRIAQNYPGFSVIPGAEVSSRAGHVLALDIQEDIPKGLSVEETVDRIHDLGGIAVASHPFSTRASPSLREDCLKTDGIEVFNAMNRGRENELAMTLAQTYLRPRTAGSDAHWVATVGTAGIICDDPIEDIVKRRTKLFGSYTRITQVRSFQFRELASALVNRPLWK